MHGPEEDAALAVDVAAVLVGEGGRERERGAERDRPAQRDVRRLSSHVLQHQPSTRTVYPYVVRSTCRAEAKDRRTNEGINTPFC